MPQRGPLPDSLTAAYEAAHGQHNGAQAGPAGEPLGAALPPATAPQDAGSGSAAREEEHTPRTVRGPRTGARARQTAGRLRNKLTWGPQRGKSRRKKPDRGPRIPVTDMIEEAWDQLAWAAAPILPLNRILAIQAPFAGVVLEDAVRGTFADALLQPVARTEKVGRAAMGMLGPPVIIMVMLQTDQESPQYAWLNGMLRFSMLSMAKAADLNAEEAIQRAERNREAAQQVDMLISYIFSAPGTAPPPGAGQTIPGEVIREDPAEAERADAEARNQQAFGMTPGGPSRPVVVTPLPMPKPPLDPDNWPAGDPRKVDWAAGETSSPS